MVSQFIPTYHSAPPIVIIAQLWPCWLVSALSLQLPVIGAYFASRFHKFFALPESLNLMSSWSTVEHLCGLHEIPLDCTILVSGSMTFLATVLRWCGEHSGPQVFAVDHHFHRTTMRDTLRLYRSWASHRMREGFVSDVLHHSEYGGATNAAHFVFHRGMGAGSLRPVSCVPRSLRHFVNHAAKGGFVAIDAPPAIPHDIESRHPMVVDDLGRVDGLYDVCRPALDYAVPCVFKSSGWVRRRLTAKEWLVLHDTPVDLATELGGDGNVRNAIALCITPLIVSALYRTWWGGHAGGGRD